MTGKPWLEEWEETRGLIEIDESKMWPSGTSRVESLEPRFMPRIPWEQGITIGYFGTIPHPRGEGIFDSDDEADIARGKLAAAAPAMARALCRLERSGAGPGNECPVCGYLALTESEYGPVGHANECPLDAALTSAGLDAAAREEVRSRK